MGSGAGGDGRVATGRTRVGARPSTDLGGRGVPVCPLRSGGPSPRREPVGTPRATRPVAWSVMRGWIDRTCAARAACAACSWWRIMPRRRRPPSNFPISSRPPDFFQHRDVGSPALQLRQRRSQKRLGSNIARSKGGASPCSIAQAAWPHTGPRVMPIMACPPASMRPAESRTKPSTGIPSDVQGR